MPIRGYRRVDGRATRWEWTCPICDDSRDEIRTRRIAREELLEHKSNECQEGRLVMRRGRMVVFR